MRTKDLVKMLRSKFGSIDAIWIRFFKASEREDRSIIVLEGALVAVTSDDKTLCGGTIVRAECDFMNAMYNISLGPLVHSLLMKKAYIYARYRYGNLLFIVYVPCEIIGVNLNKFVQVPKREEECSYANTDKCPLFKVPKREE